VAAQCCICERNLDGTDWLCHECAEKYELNGSLTQWPEWARFMKQQEENRRYTERRDLRQMVSIEECAEAEILVYGEVNSDRFE